MNHSFTQEAQKTARQARSAFRQLRILERPKRDAVLLHTAEKLQKQYTQRKLLEANKEDIQRAQEAKLSLPLIERLKLDTKRIEDMAHALEQIAALPDPAGEVLGGARLANGLNMIQKRVPLGVIFTVYESRPNVTIDVGALCLKSGNCAILRGGKEAMQSNLALFALFQEAMAQEALPQAAIQFVKETDRSYMQALLEQEAYIDLVVPRGGEQLIQFVTKHSRIPVVKHDKGVCNLYIDASAALDEALAIAVNAKLSRPSVCNAIENLIVHKDFPDTKALLEGLALQGAKLLGRQEAKDFCDNVQLIAKGQEAREYSQEYLDERLAVKIVADIKEALDFVFLYGSGHSEAIVARDSRAISAFQKNVDTAAVFVNCSTRFHDGGQMALGAEVGISTGRLHVRGPMSLKDLCTSTYLIEGQGQLRS